MTFAVQCGTHYVILATFCEVNSLLFYSIYDMLICILLPTPTANIFEGTVSLLDQDGLSVNGWIEQNQDVKLG